MKVALKSAIGLAIAIVFAASLLVGCSKTNAASSGGKEIRVFNGKIEIDEPLKAFAALYEAKTGVKVIIESSGGGTDNQSVLKGYKASGNMPDIFGFEGPGQFAIWKEDYVALDGEDWIADTTSSYVDNGHVYGFPFAVEGYGLGYNAELLAKAEIDPASLTTYGAYEAAFKKLDSMKGALGIDAVVAMAAGVAPGMTWVTGTHNFGVYLSAGLADGDKHVINDALQGKVDSARLAQYARYVKLLFDYSEQTVLLTGNYDQQVQLFTDQRAVFIHQGNWIDPTIEQSGAKFNMGYAPHAFLDTTIDGIQVDAPSYWGVYKDGNVEEAKKFLSAIALSEEGRDARINKMHLISPYKSDTMKPETPFSAAVSDYVSRGKTYPWEQMRLPEGFCQDTLGPIYELLAQKQISTEQFASMVSDAVATIPSK
ncbi:MAG: extracellular solute-binding protein [Treponema sp.]|nr:extracellular solute-binding protein [Treponema sp.]